MNCEAIKMASRKSFIALGSKDFWSSLGGFLAIASLIIIVWIANFFLMPWMFPNSKGESGDMFGALTALFSGLAFAGLITTLFMQRKELELQRGELSQTREVFHIQRFENTFFGLLRLLAEYCQSIEVSERSVGILTETDSPSQDYENGKSALRLLAKGLPEEKWIIGERNRYGEPQLPDREAKSLLEMQNEYSKYYTDTVEPYLGPYFRLIYSVLRLIDKAEFNTGTPDREHQIKLDYAKILRAQLSSSEVLLVMFNCATIHGKGLKGWVEKYALLRHITRKDYERYAEITDFYERGAFNFEARN